MLLFSGLTLVVLSNFLTPAFSDYINPDDCRITFYYVSELNYISYKLSEAVAVVVHPEFRYNRTVLFIPDYYEPQLEGSQTNANKEGYLRSKDTNVLVLDWGAPVVPPDQVKDPDLDVLVPETSNWLIQMHELINWDGFHVLAYAKGVEFISNVVHDMFRRTEFRFHRITHLAPPQELIVDGEAEGDDSNLITEFIDAIHTDIGATGTTYNRAHVNFYPNGGTFPQPGCSPKGFCSRRRSYLYYAETINARNHHQQQDSIPFCAYKADSYEDFESTEDKSELGEPIQMGRFVPYDARGNYYLDTNSDSPYAQGC